MRTIVLCNRLDRLQRITAAANRPLDFICLQSPLENLDALDFLRSAPDCTEIPAVRLAGDLKAGFRKDFIDFMGRTNAANHSQDWWALPFTNKNALTGGLCRNLFQFQLVVGAAAEGGDDQFLVVLTSNCELAEQTKRWGRGCGFLVRSDVKNEANAREIARKLLPLGPVKSILTTGLMWALGRRLRPGKDGSGRKTLIATHTHARSFAQEGTYEDAYFGPLVGELAQSEQGPVVVGLPYEQPLGQMGQMKRLRAGFPVLPVESCLALSDVLVCSLRALWAYWRPTRVRQTPFFRGADVSYLMREAIRESTRSGDFFISLKVLHAARWLSRRVGLTRCLYPFENRSWEKMLVMGMTEGSPDIRMVGYQHTSMTPHHANFFMAEGEAAITPLPHAIVTCGDVTRDWILEEGNYPDGMVTSACALRQTLAENPPAIGKDSKSNTAIKNLLVILATGEEEYALTFQFLSEALEGNERFQVRLRPHPNLPMLEVPDLPGVSISTGPLPDELQWADAVLYASSTVSMEAIALGIPAIFLDLETFLSTDPMYGWNGFKWELSEPSQLAETIDEIQSIPQDRFQKLQQRGLDYVYSYLKPVTPANMRPFWDS